MWEILKKTDIDEDDPLFLVLLAMGTLEASVVEIPETLARREKILQELATKLEANSATLETTANDIVTAASGLETKLKAQVPKFHQRHKLNLKELAVTIVITFLAGSIFGPSLTDIAQAAACEFGSLCSVEQQEQTQ